MEAFFEVEAGVRIRYVVDDYTDPWRRADTVLLVLESDAWHAAGALPDDCAKATADFLARAS
jgi:hypothetical protein